MADTQGDAIPFEVAGRLLMIGPERVRQLVKSGYISRERPGFTTIVSAVRGYIRFLKEDERKDTQKAAASRATDARTREIELRIAERMRELITIDDAKAELAAVVSEVRAEIVGMGARVTRDLELRRQIDSEADGILQRLAERAEQASRALSTEGGAVASEREA